MRLSNHYQVNKKKKGKIRILFAYARWTENKNQLKDIKSKKNKKRGKNKRKMKEQETKKGDRRKKEEK